MSLRVDDLKAGAPEWVSGVKAEGKRTPTGSARERIASLLVGGESPGIIITTLYRVYYEGVYLAANKKIDDRYFMTIDSCQARV